MDNLGNTVVTTETTEPIILLWIHIGYQFTDYLVSWLRGHDGDERILTSIFRRAGYYAWDFSDASDRLSIHRTRWAIRALDASIPLQVAVWDVINLYATMYWTPMILWTFAFGSAKPSESRHLRMNTTDEGSNAQNVTFDVVPSKGVSSVLITWDTSHYEHLDINYRKSVYLLNLSQMLTETCMHCEQQHISIVPMNRLNHAAAWTSVGWILN